MVVVVTEEGAEVVDVQRGGASVDVKDVSIDGTEGEVTVVMVVKEVILSDEEEKGVEAEGVELDSEGVAWAGFDSSHWPFLQRETAERATDKKRHSVLQLLLQDSRHMLSSGTQREKSCKQHTEQNTSQ